MQTLTARTLPTINTIQLIGVSGGEVGSMSSTGHISGHMALHLKAPEDVRYLVSDTHDLTLALDDYGYRLDPEAHAAAAAAIDRAYVDARAGLRLSVRKLDVIDVHDATCRLVPTSDLSQTQHDATRKLALAVDPSRIAATVHVSPLGSDDLEIRLRIFRIPRDVHPNPQQPLIHTTWIAHTLIGVRRILDTYGYELTYAAEYALMKLFTSTP